MFESDSMAELRAAVAAYHTQSLPPKIQHPDAPGCENLPDKAREQENIRYGESILRTPAGQLTAEDRAFLKQGIAAWTQEQG